MGDIIKVDNQIQAFSAQPTRYCREITNNINTVKEAYLSSNVCLAQYNRDAPEDLKAVMIRFIEGMLLYFGRDRNDMNNSQVTNIVNDILRNYYYFHLEDICLCFKKARMSNHYDKFYGRIDGKTIMSWFAEYDKERDEIVTSIPEYQNQEIAVDACTPQQYKEDVITRLQCGDDYANEELQNILRREHFLNRGKIEYGNYKYQRKHKFD